MNLETEGIETMLIDAECCGCHRRVEDVLAATYVPTGHEFESERACPGCGGTTFVRPGIELPARMDAQWSESCRGDGHKYLGDGKPKKRKSYHKDPRDRAGA